MPDNKAELRALIRVTRAARTTTERVDSAAGFHTAITALVEDLGWTSVAAFLPIDVEPPITETLASLVAAGVRVRVPVSSPNGLLDWIELTAGSLDELSTDSMGMPIPTNGQHTTDTAVDAVFVPAAAVDRDGNRLGWGKGYYDRYLETVTDAVVVAVVFDSDVLDAIPIEAHDKPVDLIVTERDIYRTA